jgi:4-amino-4-deoxy-L-arabinose transferase-like glycosyltransferase
MTDDLLILKNFGRIGKLITIGTVLLVAFFLRIWRINYDLPYIYHPDEPGYITISQNIFKTGDLNPHFFNYPSLFFYINAISYIPYYLFGKMVGIFHTRDDILPPISLAMGVTLAQMPTTVLLGRIITISFGIGTVILAYFIGKQITGRMSVGILASLMTAISPTNVWHSRLITPDTFVTFFSAASFLAITLVYQQGKMWQYAVAGICIGLTASTKYNGGLIILPLILAHFLRYGKKALKCTKLYLSVLLCMIGFLIATPYAILDSSKFIADLSFEAKHYSTGHAGMEGDSLKWYLKYMWDTGNCIYLIAAIGILHGLMTRSKESILISVFPLTYFVFISSFIVRNDRTFLPMTVFMFLLAAKFLIDMFYKIKNLRIGLLEKRFFFTLFFIMTAAMLTIPFSKTITDIRHFTTVNSRETARIWIEKNLPSGSKIAIESYSPFINPSKFRVYGFGRIIDHSPEWYVEQDFNYLIFSEGMFGRFYHDPQRYRREISQYDSFFERFTLVKIFTDGDYEIRIYKIK